MVFNYELLFDITEKCVKFGEFRLVSGKISPYKIDIDPLTGYKSSLTRLAKQMLGFSKNMGFRPDYFVGVPSGTTMLAREMTDMIDYKYGNKIVFREKESEYKGPVEKGDKVVLVEDVVTSGSSIKREMEKMHEKEVEVIGVIAIVDRFEHERFDFPYGYAVGIDEIFEVLKRNGKIPENYREKVEEYMKLNIKNSSATVNFKYYLVVII